MESEFWILEGPRSTRKLAEWDVDAIELEPVVCPETARHNRPGRRLSNLTVELPAPPVGDFVKTWFADWLIQQPVADLFQENGFIGFDLRPVSARFSRPRPEPPPIFWELRVCGWGGMARPESGVQLIDSCESCGMLLYSAWNDATALFDRSQWDGSDLFMVWPLPKYIWITDRVRQALKRQRFKGAHALAPQEWVRNPSVLPRLAPGRLSYWLPDEDAKRIGEPLGIY